MAEKNKMNLVDIQAEKGELIHWPNGSLTPVHAKRTHSQMERSGDEDMVTDTPAENSFIFSSYGGIKLTRKDAEDLIIGVKRYPYSENKRNKEPELFTLADKIFKKNEKKISPAKAAQRIQQKYKVVENKDDIFDVMTDDLNKANREPYLTGIAVLSEIERMKQELEDAMPVVELVPNFKKGGKVRSKHLSAYQGGGFNINDIFNVVDIASDVFNIPFLSQGVDYAGEIFGFGGDNAEQRERQRALNALTGLTARGEADAIANLQQNKELTDLILGDVTSGYDALAQGRTGQGLFNILSSVTQDPSVQFTELGTDYLDEMELNARRPYWAAQRIGQQNLGSLNSLYRNVQDPALQSSLLGNARAQTYANNDRLLYGAERDLSTNLNNILAQRQNVLERNITGLDDKANTETLNRNAILRQALGEAGSLTGDLGMLPLSQAYAMDNLRRSGFDTQMQIQDKKLSDELNAMALRLALFDPESLSANQQRGSVGLVNKASNCPCGTNFWGNCRKNCNQSGSSGSSGGGSNWGDDGGYGF